MKDLAAQLQQAIDQARATKPADCTCDGLHTDAVDSGLSIAAIIAAERSFGSCPAELRALERIAARL